VTAVTAPASMPLANVPDDLSVDGCLVGFALRFRVAAARAAVFLRATFFFGARFTTFFLLAVRFAARFRVAFFAT
jgi:hypothetical protein